ncbi:hypothetical protein AGOR_G00242500 [Albula goreensis]|uniref:Uncharacterized protein n=1 Tax=Albula goreensis TaxID=1534307 RepID=A0A8T3CJD2_9TELE|nr:hypothetical protein AGOR_G00242500 [Albula goreensis]
MMEEVSIAAAYDAHIINQTTEEDLLASLVADSRLRAALPNQKPREAEKKVQRPTESQPPVEEPIQRYQRENKLLQKASIRLEQENDVLAHELVTSKIALRNDLDQVEDKADLLNTELLQARLQLAEATEERRVQEQETTQLKDLFRTQLEEAESRRKKSAAIMDQYKQICSQLNSRLESQQAGAKAELDQLKSKVEECERCREVFDEVAQHQLPPADEKQRDFNPCNNSQLRSRQQELELELAQAKLQLVEAECRIQELEHQKGALMSEFQYTRNSWFSKALSSLKRPTAQH